MNHFTFSPLHVSTNHGSFIILCCTHTHTYTSSLSSPTADEIRAEFTLIKLNYDSMCSPIFAPSDLLLWLKQNPTTTQLWSNLSTLHYQIILPILKNFATDIAVVYLSGRCCCILVMSPMLGSDCMYMVARIPMATKSQDDGLAGYTPLIRLFC